MKVLLFGGTFDPPHNGHMAILKNAIQTVQPQKVVVMPANIPPHKQASATPAALRLAMCRCFCPLFADMDVSDLEVRHSGKSYTLYTVQQLQKLCPGARVHLCIGSDMLHSFTTWHAYKQLLSLVVLVVQNRAGEDTVALFKAAHALEMEGAHIVFAQGDTPDISSSQVRAAIAAGRDVAALVPPPVGEIIRQNGLYRCDKGEEETITPAQAKQLARQMLSAKRFAHEANVVQAAKRLAQRYGASEQKAELAGWLHDIAKELPREDLLRMLGQDAIIAGQSAQRPLPVWHGPCAAIYAKHNLHLKDEEILSAVGCHTTGKVGMGKLDKIVYVADMISAERDYPGVEELRRLAMEDLDAAVVAAMQRSIEYVQACGKPLDEESLKALQDVQWQMRANNNGRGETIE